MRIFFFLSMLFSVFIANLHHAIGCENSPPEAATHYLEMVADNSTVAVFLPDAPDFIFHASWAEDSKRSFAFRSDNTTPDIIQSAAIERHSSRFRRLSRVQRRHYDHSNYLSASASYLPARFNLPELRVDRPPLQ